MYLSGQHCTLQNTNTSSGGLDTCGGMNKLTNLHKTIWRDPCCTTISLLRFV